MSAPTLNGRLPEIDLDAATLLINGWVASGAVRLIKSGRVAQLLVAGYIDGAAASSGEFMTFPGEFRPAHSSNFTPIGFLSDTGASPQQRRIQRHVANLAVTPYSYQGRLTGQVVWLV